MMRPAPAMEAGAGLASWGIPMPLHRFRLRTLMTAVAGVRVGLAVGPRIVRLKQKAREYSRKAAIYRRDEVAYRSIITKLDSPRSQRVMARIPLPILQRKLEYYAFLHVKYERAACRPWLPVPPDLT